MSHGNLTDIITDSVTFVHLRLIAHCAMRVQCNAHGDPAQQENRSLLLTERAIKMPI